MTPRMKTITICVMWASATAIGCCIGDPMTATIFVMCAFLGTLAVLAAP